MRPARLDAHAPGVTPRDQTMAPKLGTPAIPRARLAGAALK
jgi:hypothetical protein